jgi:hypothetical protein
MIVSLLSIAAIACAHSWVEQIQVIGDDACYLGASGYPCGYIPSASPSFSDAAMTYLLPAAGEMRARISGEDLVCAPTQRTAKYSRSYTMLNAMPGNYIAIKYLENGHVTLADIPLGKPEAGGIVKVFLTLNSSATTILTTSLSWTKSGPLTDGRLLTSQYFDDGRCYQLNASPISTSRQVQFLNPIPNQLETLHEQWCETNMQIPMDTRLLLCIGCGSGRH